MFVIFNKDGSIFAKTQSDFVMQGSNRVNKIFVGFVDNDYTDWTCNGVFNLPNSTRWTIPAVPVVNGFDYLGVNYKGWQIELTDDVTKYEGVLSVSIQLVSSETNVLYTYLTRITINKTGLPVDGYWDESITVAQFNDYMAQLAVKLQANTVSVELKEEDLPEVGEKNVLYFIIGATSETPYEVKMWNGSEYVPLGTINLSSFASKEEQAQFEAGLITQWNNFRNSLNNRQNTFETGVQEDIEQIRGEVTFPFVVVDSVSDLPDTNQNRIYLVKSEHAWYYWDDTQNAYVLGNGLVPTLAQDVLYENADSNLDAYDVQSAIDELAEEKVNFGDYAPLNRDGLADNIHNPDGWTDNAEFAFRGTAGNVSIINSEEYKGNYESYATVKEIRGNTIIKNQLQKISTIPTFTNETTGLTFTNNNDGSITISGTVISATSNEIGLTNSDSLSVLKGKQYLWLLENNIAGLRLRIAAQSNSMISNGANYLFFEGSTDRVNNSTIYLGVGQNLVGQTLNLTIKPRLINLTLMFGEGNEPTTLAKFNNLTRYIDTDTYDEGSFRSLNDDLSFTSVGFNAFDGELYQGNWAPHTNEKLSNSNFICCNEKIPVVCGETYTLTSNLTNATNIYIGAFDKNNIWLGWIHEGYPFVNTLQGTMPDNACYVIIQFFNSNGISIPTDAQICFHLTHSGYRNGQYKPYWKETRELNPPVSVQLASAGNAYDVWTKGKNIRNIGEVDLGSLNWAKGTANVGFRFYAYIGNTLKGASADSVANISTPKYSRISLNEARVDIKDKAIAAYTNGYVYIVDTSFDDSSAEEFKTSLSGVKLLYEKATPEIVEYEDKDDWFYKVDDFGTESVNNGIVKADIHYEVNLRDFIRGIGLREDIGYDPSKLVSRDELLVVDSELSVTSENPVQNKVITEKINGLGHLINQEQLLWQIGWEAPKESRNGTRENLAIYLSGESTLPFWLDEGVTININKNVISNINSTTSGTTRFMINYISETEVEDVLGENIVENLPEQFITTKSGYYVFSFRIVNYTGRNTDWIKTYGDIVTFNFYSTDNRERNFIKTIDWGTKNIFSSRVLDTFESRLFWACRRNPNKPALYGPDRYGNLDIYYYQYDTNDFSGTGSYTVRQSILKVEDEIWLFASSPDGNIGIANAIRLKIHENGFIERKAMFWHNFGHLNSISYDKESNCIIFGNGSGDYDLEGKAYIIRNFRESKLYKPKENEIVLLSDLDIDEISLPIATYGKKTNVISFGTCAATATSRFLNIALITNDGNVVRLGRIDVYNNQQPSWANVEWITEKTFSTESDSESYNHVVQTAIYFNGKLCWGTGHSGPVITIVDTNETGELERKVKYIYAYNGQNVSAICNFDGKLIYGAGFEIIFTDINSI